MSPLLFDMYDFQKTWMYQPYTELILYITLVHS